MITWNSKGAVFPQVCSSYSSYPKCWANPIFSWRVAWAIPTVVQLHVIVYVHPVNHNLSFINMNILIWIHTFYVDFLTELIQGFWREFFIWSQIGNLSKQNIGDDKWLSLWMSHWIIQKKKTVHLFLTMCVCFLTTSLTSDYELIIESFDGFVQKYWLIQEWNSTVALCWNV